MASSHGNGNMNCFITPICADLKMMTPGIRPTINQPLIIGQKTINNRLFLAPMAGLGHIAFRELLSQCGGYGLLFMEMCNARAVPHENRHFSPVFRWRDEELPYLVCQIFGATPVDMARAAERIESEGFFGVDLNFGCSVQAIVKKNCGAALLKNPVLSSEIVKTVRKAVSVPVFVKYRIGWEDDPGFSVDMARRFEDAGADALTFHPRVAPDRRSRPPKWDYIRQVKAAVSIPVFGNGNVFDENDLEAILLKTACDGVSLGRIAIAKPWLFAAWSKDIQPADTILKETILKMIALLNRHFEPHMAIKLFKKYAIYFAANFKFGHAIYKELSKAGNMEAVEQHIHLLFEKNPATLKRPDLNMFTR